LGEWYAFRRLDAWAIELLERARAGGAPVSALTLARCYWACGDRDSATREFRRALAGGGEAPEWYLRLCIAAASR
jgi:hypothetical protein